MDGWMDGWIIMLGLIFVALIGCKYSCMTIYWFLLALCLHYITYMIAQCLQLHRSNRYKNWSGKPLNTCNTLNENKLLHWYKCYHQLRHDHLTLFQTSGCLFLLQGIVSRCLLLISQLVSTLDVCLSWKWNCLWTWPILSHCLQFVVSMDILLGQYMLHSTTE